MTKLIGMIDKIIYYNDENGYTVASFLTDEHDKITIVGTFDRKPYEEEEYVLQGVTTTNSKYGEQFKFTSFERHSFDSLSGLVTYFSSDLFPGIGEKTARQIIKKLGLNAVDKIKTDPSVLNGLKLTASQISTIVSTLILESDTNDTTVFLLNHGISIDMAHRIINVCTDHDIDNIVDFVKTNPYQLIDLIDHFGFKKADGLAESLGIKKSEPIRLRALLSYVLKEVLYGSGNSYISRTDLYQAIVKYTGEEIDEVKFRETLDFATSNKKIYIDDKNNIFDYEMHKEELKLAKELSLLISDKRSKEGIKKYTLEEVEKAFNEVKKESHIKYNNEQLDAIHKAFNEPFVIITGGPGTGKTTIIHAVLRMYFLLNEDNKLLADKVALLAPTGRAAKRLSDATLMKAQTIHKYLGYMGDGHFKYNEYVRTDDRLIICDEASMIDTSLASHLICSMHQGARLILVGDVDQLPSVGPGQVLKDLIDSKEISVVRLNKIHRQADDSSIIKLAHEVNDGFIPEDIMDKKKDRIFLPVEKTSLTNAIKDIYLKYLEKGYTHQDLQILIPMYKGIGGINEINSLIQETTNHQEEAIKSMGRTFYKGDKVIQLVNRADKGIMNGDIGYIESFTKTTDNKHAVRISFEGLDVEYGEEDLEDISLAYAVSIHKAQGSEFPIVLMPFNMGQYIMLRKKLIYTGITRAKQTLVMLGEINALSMGVRRIENPRNTILKEEIIKNLHDDIVKSETSTSSIRDVLKNLENNQEQEKINDTDDLGAEEIILNPEDI